MKLSIVVPAYNEYDNLKELLPALVAYCVGLDYQLIIVNDGSTDGTKILLQEHTSVENLTIVHHKINKGYGAALKTGIRHVETEYVATMDADGQHDPKDVTSLFQQMKEIDGDMIIGKRAINIDTFYRKVGKWIILKIAKLLLPMTISDINSGMKIYRTDLAKNYMHLYPDTMSYNIIPMIFISQGHLVTEHLISIEKRLHGSSNVSNDAGFTFIMDLLNMVMLFNPMRLFLPISALCLFVGFGWGIPIVIEGNGVSIGAMLGIITGLVIFFIGLVAEQLSQIRKSGMRDLD